MNYKHLWCENDKQLYKQNIRNAQGHLGFTCITSKCSARIYENTNNENTKIYYFGSGYNGHTHGSAEKIKAKNELTAKIKIACQNLDDADFGSNIKSVTNIYNSTITNHG